MRIRLTALPYPIRLLLARIQILRLRKSRRSSGSAGRRNSLLLLMLAMVAGPAGYALGVAGVRIPGLPLPVADTTGVSPAPPAIDAALGLALGGLLGGPLGSPSPDAAAQFAQLSAATQPGARQQSDRLAAQIRLLDAEIVWLESELLRLELAQFSQGTDNDNDNDNDNDFDLLAPSPADEHEASSTGPGMDIRQDSGFASVPYDSKSDPEQRNYGNASVPVNSAP